MVKETPQAQAHDNDDYEYRGLMALAWDLLRGDTSGWEDRPLYRRVVLDEGEPALDVGCGTGRLLLDYLAEGLNVEGVDISPEMLAICREKAQERGLSPTVYRQTMESLDLPRRYRTIFVPSSSFQLLVDQADAGAAMLRFYEHLYPGGKLVMPFMKLWAAPAVGGWTNWRLRERVRPGDGALIRRWSRVRHDDETQLEDTEDRYEVVVGGETVETEHHERSPATRSYTLQRAIDLYQATGFMDVFAVRGFTDLPASSEDKVFTLSGTRR